MPSWKLVTEVYDPVKMQAALQKFAEAYSRETVKAGNQPLRIAQEMVEGRTYYMIAGGDGSPLTEVALHLCRWLHDRRAHPRAGRRAPCR